MATKYKLTIWVEIPAEGEDIEGFLHGLGDKITRENNGTAYVVEEDE